MKLVYIGLSYFTSPLRIVSHVDNCVEGSCTLRKHITLNLAPWHYSLDVHTRNMLMAETACQHGYLCRQQTSTAKDDRVALDIRSNLSLAAVTSKGHVDIDSHVDVRWSALSAYVYATNERYNQRWPVLCSCSDEIDAEHRISSRVRCNAYWDTRVERHLRAPYGLPSVWVLIHTCWFTS